MLTASEHALYALLGRLSAVDQLGRALAERCLPRGLTLAQFGVLGVLARDNLERSPLQLAREFGVTKQTMTTTLARLGRAELVHIRRDPADGRAKLVSLTDSGAAVYRRSMEGLGPALAVAADIMPIALADTLVRQLEELEKVLRAASRTR